MRTFSVDLGHRAIVLREPVGRDEWSIGGPGSAVALLDALRVDDGSPDAAAWTIAERDRALAALHRRLFGDHVAAACRCDACGEPFEIAFSLDGLIRSLGQGEPPPEVEALLADGRARLASGHVVRAVTGVDEAAVAAIAGRDPEAAVEALAARCVEGDTDDAPIPGDVLDRVHEWLAPVLDVDLVGTCPECGARQEVAFSLEHWLVTKLAREHRRLLREVHLLARAYGWPLDHILALGRGERGALAAMVEADRAAGAGGP